MESKSLKLASIQIKKKKKTTTLFVKAMINTRNSKGINMKM